jgi:hypothetical protein
LASSLAAGEEEAVVAADARTAVRTRAIRRHSFLVLKAVSFSVVVERESWR